ncbi:macro domain-containing protein [Paraburkholderia terrae]|uniref:Appr-1-p processing protein n=1 Tax=Paraburkholderia terrae TaxID=311230 RepID=A0A2I8EVQ7_9BURK|nr:macro domain-containing protein [Paraburkholderia terrae]AUT62874.1 Appr-1-p processing protein [Paraburkholderia terrae]
MRIRFRDLNPRVSAAVAAAFADVPALDVQCADILAAGPADAIVSPANSLGYMDGGIDLAYSMHFGPQLQRDLQALIANLPERRLQIGEAIIVATGDEGIPALIAAPTMETPGPVPNTINAFLAFRATLRAIAYAGFGTVLCPGLATLTGRMLPDVSASQMRAAWNAFNDEQRAIVRH